MEANWRGMHQRMNGERGRRVLMVARIVRRGNEARPANVHKDEHKCLYARAALAAAYGCAARRALLRERAAPSRQPARAASFFACAKRYKPRAARRRAVQVPSAFMARVWHARQQQKRR